MKATFSIIVPVHNVGAHLPTCIDSIVEQRCLDIEIILIDDQSTDGSATICDHYAQKYDYVHVIHLDKNQGVAAARNHGLSAATGDYIIFVDGDDCLVDGSLGRVKRLIDQIGQVDTVICRFYSESKVLSNDAMFLADTVGKVEPEVVLKHLTRIDYYLDHCWPYVISRALIVRNNVRFIKSTIAEDAEYIVRLLALASSAAYCEGDFYVYRERDGSLKTSRGVAQTVSFLQVAYAMQQLLEYRDRSNAQKAFVESQIRHTLCGFRARLSMLSNDDMYNFSSLISREELSATIQLSSSADIPSALIAYRQAIEDATLSLISAATPKNLYIYCTGPSGEAVAKTLLAAGYAIQNVIDDNKTLTGRTMLGIPIITADYFSTLTADELKMVCIVICTQKKTAYDKISDSLLGRGIARHQIFHRIF
jgi:glycosyltransferase involved in cell wall biosynthesis